MADTFPQLTKAPELLHGHREISAFLGISEAMLDKVLAIKFIPVCRITGTERGKIVASTRQVIQAIEEEAERQMAALRKPNKPKI